MSEVNKSVINNWSGGGTLQTWTDGEWQILYVKDSAGNVVTLSLTSHDAVRLAYAVSQIPGEQFDRMRGANSAVYELSYPEARADELRQIADEIECDGGCEGCSPQKIERGKFCGFVSAENLRKLAAALDLKAKVDADQTVPLPSAPVGYKLVPVEATEEMLDEAVKGTPADVSYGGAEMVWDAMLAAAPTPPTASPVEDAAREAAGQMFALLVLLNRLGGLGYEKHKWIDTALSAARAVGLAPEGGQS